MKVLLVEPEKTPREVEIDNSLEALQSKVGGLIEMVYPYRDPVALVCNEEGKLMGLPFNRALYDDHGQPYEIIAGSFLVVGLAREDIGGLSPELLEKYKNLFKTPEMFYPAGKDQIYIIPMEAEEQEPETQEAAEMEP